MNKKIKNKAIFLDRDGVIIKLPLGKKDHAFTLKKQDSYIIPRVPEALEIFKNLGYKIFVITNQPAVARGIVPPKVVDELHSYINKQLGGLIDKFYWCPHHPETHHNDIPKHALKYRIKCDCRKPLPGLIHQAAIEFNIDLKNSWMMGDMITDIACGKAAGCKTILIKSYLNNRIIIPVKKFNQKTKPNYTANNLYMARKHIIK